MDTFWARRAGRTVLLTASLAGAVLLTAACGGADAERNSSDGHLTGKELVAAAKDECDSITWYSSSDAELVERISEDFEKKYGIRVDWMEAGSADVASRLITETRAGGTKADVVTGPIETLAPLSDQGMFQPYSSAHSDEAEPTIVESFGDYAKVASPFALGTFGIVYNSNEVSADEAPKSWKELAEGEFDGSMAGADPRYGVTYATVIDFLAKKYGWEYWDKVGAQLRLARGGGDTQALLVTGEKDLLAYAGFTIALTAIHEEKAPITTVVPEEGLLVYSLASTMTENTECPNAAQLLVDHTTDKQSQSMVTEYGYYAAHTGIPTPQDQPDLDEVEWQPTDWQVVADPKQYEEIVGRFEQALKG